MSKVFIIAEAGVNHNGDYNLAIKMIDEAKISGADAVKFQTAVPELVMTKSAGKADYQKETTGESGSQLEMAKKIHLDLSDYASLKKYCEQKQIIFLSTPFDFKSINLLDSIGMEIWKIPSGEITNLPYLRIVGRLAKEIILSTGMSDMGEIEDALNILIKAGMKKKNITILHANTMYPTPMEDVNLKAMITIGDKLNVAYGYSDHTLGIEVPIAAVAMGASVIEKHFTLDSGMYGPDHKASLEPDELKDMINSIRNIELALGSNIKKTSKSELPNKVIARKSIVATCDIKKGETLIEENLTVKRPGSGISPMLWDDIVGSVASKDYSEDELI